MSNDLLCLVVANVSIHISTEAEMKFKKDENYTTINKFQSTSLPKQR